MTATEQLDHRTEHLGVTLARAICTEKSVSACPSDEELALLLDGRLNETEADTVYRHLAGCERCYRIFLAAGSLDDVTQRAPRRFFSWPRLGLAVAALLIAGLSVVLTRRPDEIRSARQEAPDTLSAPAVSAPSSDAPVATAPQPPQASPGTTRQGVLAKAPAQHVTPLVATVRLLAQGEGSQRLLREVRQATAEAEPGYSSGFANSGEGIGLVGHQAMTLGQHLLLLRFALQQGIPDDRRRLLAIVENDLRHLDAPAAADALATAGDDSRSIEKALTGAERALTSSLRSYVTLGWWCEAILTAAAAKQGEFFRTSAFAGTLRELEGASFPAPVRDRLAEMAAAAGPPLSPESFQRFQQAAGAVMRIP